MFKKITEKFKGDRKYFSIVFFILILLAVSGIITESFLNTTKENWDSILTDKISELQKSITADFDDKQNNIVDKINLIRQDLRKSLTPENESYKEIVRLINDKEFDNYSIEIFAPNGKLIAWNQIIAIEQDELFPLSFPLGETYFLSKDLVNYLSIIDTTHLESDIFYISISTSIEEKFKLNNQFSRNINFTSELNSRFQNDIEIDYSPYAEKSRDGRKYSFELLNTKQIKIGVVTFVKPLLNGTVSKTKETSTKIQSLLVVLAILFVGFGLKNDFGKLSSHLFRFILLIIYLAALRAIIFVVGFPSNFISGPLSDPSYFSSAFGWGIVKSPIEFFTTILFIVLVAVQIFRYTRNYLHSSKKIKYKYAGYVGAIGLSIIIFLILRGLSAAIRSIIFDSTIRYFKEPNILPDLPSFAMNFNMLLLAFASVLAIMGAINLIFKFIDFEVKSSNKSKIFIIITVITLILGTSFYFSKDALIPLVMLLVFVLLLFFLFYQITFKNKNSIYNYLFILLIGSIISIALLNYFNTKLERESLKTTAFEINRADSNLLSFMLDETLRDIKNNNDIFRIFGDRYANYDALAFKIWANSAMQRESLNSGIRFYDKNKNILGEYYVGLNPDKKVFDYLSKPNEINIVELESDKGKSDKYYTGIIKIEERGITKGYVSVFVSFDIKSIGAASFPDFIESNLSILNRVIDVKQLKIFQFNGSILTEVYGDIYPSRDQIKQILQTKVDSLYNEAWLKIRFDSETYETYLLRIPNDLSIFTTTVSVEEKAFSWNLFNFFKIFIIHSLFIVFAFIIIVLSRLGKLTQSFKSKLLFAFLVISIIPVVVLALYNSKIVSERAKEGILNELSQRANYIEKHLTSQIDKNKKRDIVVASENATQELGISFALYDLTDQIYNSTDIYNRIGLFDRKLNPQAYYHLNYLRYQEYVAAEKVGGYKYDSYYRIIKVNNKDYILSVNDAFNKIKIVFSTTEINVIIFGIYSFAVIIIIIISTFFANQISQPIQQLTVATDAVSKGDLNVKIDHRERGEIKDLLDGFNQMTSELKKNQTELAEMEREAAWKEMAKQVAHEIKNPLTPMKLALQQLIISYKDKSKDFDKLFDKVSNTVLNQIDNLNQIASEFSRFAKMPSLKIETIDMLAVLNDTVNMFIHEKTSIKIITELNKAFIDADLSQLRRMFINLIRNALQANATLITIELNSVATNYIAILTDNGNGIIDSEKEKIFDEHFTTKKQGMGLGLSLAKRFMTSINGEIKLRSSVPQKTVFEIIFPAKDTFNKIINE
ncbi:MAG: HAMP domain-containing protein [Ignavibacteriales bacterium]|nr:HAMP domain-containing protein [Ignavibacteriales bacterium]